MFVIVNKKNNSIATEPSRRQSDNVYATAAAAKAGITRTIKHYTKAIEQVAEVVANGDAEYTAPMYNTFRDATDKELGRTHVADKANYRVMDYSEYKLIEPMVEKRNVMTGETFKESINTPYYMSASSETYWSA
jgi:hypothetical protein|tara:strand:- start:33 stop:434 length:402 start_codon:yes stop_codon:yes gene_type:complete